MLLTNNQLHEIINKKDPGNIEIIKVIVRYIKDKTGKDISDLPINIPDNQNQAILMHVMYEIAKQHYK